MWLHKPVFFRAFRVFRGQVIFLKYSIGIDMFLYFHYYRNMKPNLAVKALAALAQETRLSLFRMLVQTGVAGLPAGEIAKTLAIPNATLSFHLKELANADLISARQESRFIYYSANFTAMNELLDYLTENCCAGQPCAPALACCDDKSSTFPLLPLTQDTES
jgi:ArsR family transcriptional regulator, arsenate/arsenite/antimonite-responsive transcriptional repressor